MVRTLSKVRKCSLSVWPVTRVSSIATDVEYFVRLLKLPGQLTHQTGGDCSNILPGEC